jgi:hypothetical protein
VEENEFKLAQLCGLNIIINADDLMEVSTELTDTERSALPALPAAVRARHNRHP